MPTQYVLFATPSLDRRVSLEFFQSSIETEWLLRKHDIATGYKQVGGDQFIAKARNRLISEFLAEKNATDLFFIDDDVGWPAQKVLEFLGRPEQVVCGVYPRKTDSPSFPVELETQNGKLIRQNGLFSALLAPAGFMRIKRPLIERLVGGCRKYIETVSDGSKHLRYNLFEAGLLPHWEEWSGEDFDFCQKVRALGECVWIDPDITFSHRGTNRWTGNLNEPLQAHIAQHEPAETANAA